jgi:predicted metal-binding membrane protein
VGGVDARGALDRGIEAALRRERLAVALSLAALVALAWIYLWRHAAGMHAGMAMPAMPPLHIVALGLTFLMWTVMMAGMMLPSAAPTVLLYGAMARKHAERGSALPGTWILVVGYLLVWTAFSLAATLLHAALEQAALLTPMMASESKLLNGALIIAAGVYQLTPLKSICLSKCRNPVQFFMTHWRPGAAGALRMGMTHGAYCLGCCWMLMLLLFAVGVMNLAWVALVAGFVLLEKLLPAGVAASRFAGIALIIVGLAILVA